jgi:hypothetical protein
MNIRKLPRKEQYRVYHADGTTRDFGSRKSAQNHTARLTKSKPVRRCSPDDFRKLEFRPGLTFNVMQMRGPHRYVSIDVERPNSCKVTVGLKLNHKTGVPILNYVATGTAVIQSDDFAVIVCQHERCTGESKKGTGTIISTGRLSLLQSDILSWVQQRSEVLRTSRGSVHVKQLKTPFSFASNRCTRSYHCQKFADLFANNPRVLARDLAQDGGGVFDKASGRLK